MDIQIYHSGSTGNLYRVDDLLLEAGVPITQIKQSLDYKLSGITACLISHGHLDHARSAKDLMRAGVDAYCSLETSRALDLSGHRLNLIKAGEQIQVGEWKILPFSAVHDVPNLGFLMVKGDAKVLYLNDSNYVPHKFRGLTHILLGVNYDIGILRDNIESGAVHAALGNRVLNSHMSIQTAKEFFRSNDMSRVREIYLLHLSNANSDADRFQREVERVTGRPVIVT